MSNSKKFLISLLFITLLLIIFIFSTTLNKDTIYNNIYINNVEVSNLTKDEAILKLNNLFSETTITLVLDSDKYTFNSKDFKLNYDFEDAVNKAYSYGRKGSKLQRYLQIFKLKKDIINITVKKSFDINLVEQKIKELEQKTYIKPVNATVKKEEGKFIVVKESYGRKIDFEEVFNSVLNLIENNISGEIYLKSYLIKPKYISQDFTNFGDILGTYFTSFKRNNSNKGRISNIELASSRINGLVIYPEQVFSTYERFGKTISENGYKLAPTIVNGNLVQDYGGGICQVSSTLYNSVLMSELQVVQRKNHSLKVSYLDYGFDATIAGDYIDFKFKNSSKYPIYLESYTTNDKIICSIYGIETRPKNRKIEFKNTLIETIEPDKPKVKYTNSLYEGTVKTKISELKGYKYNLYKLVYEDNILKEKILVNSSYYKPRSAEILIGTKRKE